MKKTSLLLIVFMIITTCTIIGALLFSLNNLYHTPQQAASNDTVITGDHPSQLVVLHRNTPNTIELFHITAVLLDHQFNGDDSIDSTITISDQADKYIGTAHFTSLQQTITIPGYSVQLVNATADAMQLVITALSA